MGTKWALLCAWPATKAHFLCSGGALLNICAIDQIRARPGDFISRAVCPRAGARRYYLHNWGRPATSLHSVCRNLLCTKKHKLRLALHRLRVSQFSVIVCGDPWRSVLCPSARWHVFFSAGSKFLDPGPYQWRALRFCGVLFCLITSLACLCALSVEPSWPWFCIHGTVTTAR